MNEEKEKIIYLAGIVDGEGHFYKPLTVNGKGKKYYYSRLVVVQKEPELIEWLKENFGGNLYFYDENSSHIYL